mgnify:CR=1 FL=1
MVLAMLGFAIEDAFFKAATGTGDVSPGVGTMLFGLFGTGFFLLYALWRREPLYSHAYIEGPLLIRSAFEILGRLFFALSLAFAPLSTTSAILQAAPLVVTLGAALVLKEKGYPPRHYIPAADVRIERMRASDKTSRCPYKGEAEYFHMETEDGVLEDIAWAYPEPLADVAAIRGHVAFYEEKLSVEVG